VFDRVFELRSMKRWILMLKAVFEVTVSQHKVAIGIPWLQMNALARRLNSLEIPLSGGKE
jgi:hypothetical protein